MQVERLLRGVEVLALHADPEMEITGVCCDSRKAAPGMAFVASRRVGTDGHDYIDAAVAAGASLILAERPVAGCPFAVVRDGNLALAAAAANFYGNPADKMKIIGITGTKGKSTTAFNLKHILTRTLGAKVGLIGTLWYMAGEEILCESKNSTPEAPLLHETLAQMYARGCTHVVMEVSSHALDVGRVAGIPFAAAVFTNLSQDHLDYHGTMENYLAAKAKLFSMAPLGILNLDDPASAELAAHTPCAKRGFGIECPEARYRAENLDLFGDAGQAFDAVYDGQHCRVQLASAGRFMVYNALAAVSCAHSLGADFAAACEAMCSAPAVPGRLEHVEEGQNFRVIVDYAHSPESVRQICRTAREFTRGRLICVLGCGGNRDRTKRPIMGAAAAEFCDFLVITTDNPRFEEPEAIIEEILAGLSGCGREYVSIVNRHEAITRAIDAAQAGDTVLILGKGSETYQEVRGVRSYFSDVDEARKALKGRKAWKN